MRRLFSFIILFSQTFICNLFVFQLKGILSLEINDNDFELWSICSNKQSIPREMRYFSWRQLVTIPFNSKRHITKIKAMIQTENEKHIENMNLFRCNHLQSPYDSNDTVERVDNKIIIDDQNETYDCYKVLAFWTQEDQLNKTLLSLPESMGIPIGHNQYEKYLLLEINYENSDLISGLSDSSGFKLFIDKNIREIDADIVAVGSVPDFRFFIPPKLEEWTVTGNCYKQCLKSKLNNDGINILSVLYYGKHELLQDLNIEISKSNRNSRMLLNSSDENDKIDSLDKIKLENNDQMSVKCRFNSMKQNTTILGGFTRDRAQCIAWLLYYPKVDDFDVCFSSFSTSTIMAITGIEQLEEKWRNENNFEILIKNSKTNEIERLEDFLIEKTDWDYKRIHRSKYVSQYGKQTAQCNWRRSLFDEII